MVFVNCRDSVCDSVGEVDAIEGVMPLQTPRDGVAVRCLSLAALFPGEEEGDGNGNGEGRMLDPLPQSYNP